MGAAPTETCLGCFSGLTATQLAALNQVVAKGVILPGYTSIESFCEDWKGWTGPKRVAFDLSILLEEMEHIGIPASIASKIVPGCLMGSVG